MLLLDGLTLDEQRLVHETGRRRPFGAGEIIIRENESDDRLYILLSGRAMVRKTIGGRRTKELRHVEPGEAFGEISFLDSAARTADVAAVEKCEVLEMERRDLERFAVEHPGVAWKLYRNLAHELASRLRCTNNDLKEALLWAIEGWTY